MSNVVYVIRNQHGLYLNKQQEWVDGREAQSLFRCAHHDEAINTVFEVSAKDIALRAEALACPLDARKNPLVESAGQLDFGRADSAGGVQPEEAEPVDAESQSGDAADQSRRATEVPDEPALEQDERMEPDAAG